MPVEVHTELKKALVRWFQDAPQTTDCHDYLPNLVLNEETKILGKRIVVNFIFESKVLQRTYIIECTW